VITNSRICITGTSDGVGAIGANNAFKLSISLGLRSASFENTQRSSNNIEVGN